MNWDKVKGWTNRIGLIGIVIFTVAVFLTGGTGEEVQASVSLGIKVVGGVGAAIALGKELWTWIKNRT